MASLDELMRAIRERPEDDDLRLVFADALEEAGETRRAELLRAGLREEPIPAADRPILAGKTIADHARYYWFKRGLVHAVIVPTRRFVEHAGALLSAAPIRIVSIANDVRDDSDDTGPDATAEMGAKLAAVPELAQLKELGWFPECATPEFLAAWLPSPHLRSVEAVEFCFYEPRVIANIVADAPLPALRRLLFRYEIGGNGDDVADILAHSARRRSLQTLALLGLEISDAGVQSIAEVDWPALQHLTLGGSDETASFIGAEGIAALARTKAPLQRLDIEHAGLTSDALRELASATFELTALSLEYNDIEDFTPLWDARCVASLEELVLTMNTLNDDGIAALLRAPFIGRLRALDLSYTCDISDTHFLNRLIDSKLPVDVALELGKGLVYADEELDARFRARFPNTITD